jgi:hypothetical protein
VALLIVLGLALAISTFVILGPRLRHTTVEKEVLVQRKVTETKTVKRIVTVKGEKVEVAVPVEVFGTVIETKTESATVEPTYREKLWLYGMLVMGGFLGLFSIGTALVWFYFLIRKDGKAPQVVTEMLKYLVASFMGIFVGFMGGSSVATEKQATIDKPVIPAAAPK